jgi:hypothetical protein
MLPMMWLAGSLRHPRHCLPMFPFQAHSLDLIALRAANARVQMRFRPVVGAKTPV